MYLPKLPSDLELAGGKLEVDDLIRGNLCALFVRLL